MKGRLWQGVLRGFIALFLIAASAPRSLPLCASMPCCAAKSCPVKPCHNAKTCHIQKASLFRISAQSPRPLKTNLIFISPISTPAQAIVFLTLTRHPLTNSPPGLFLSLGRSPPLAKRSFSVVRLSLNQYLLKEKKCLKF